ncbi:MAG: hypothetical protein WCV62_04075 [Candidatus Peribacteraceae bacterium]|jgi:uncharacterized membrane protein
MGIILPIVGIVGSFCLIKYREQVGDMIGEAQWMKNVGGVYILVIIIAVFIFFWSLAELTGTTDVLFGPLKYLIPGMRGRTDTGMEF